MESFEVSSFDSYSCVIQLSLVEILKVVRGQLHSLAIMLWKELRS